MTARDLGWRVALAASALLQLAGAIVHALGFPSVVPAFDASSMSASLIQVCKALWLANSSSLVVIAALCAYIAVRPSSAKPALIGILALAPLMSAALIYIYLGAFFAGHLMLLASALTLWSAIAGRSTTESSW